MRIKRIELCGFKSFCDKAAIDLGQPITGVVGPNGCGKSNVVDALRWAMGELSPRHLRGKSMEDVIFAGSDSRGPSGMAEVSITFENDGRVPAEFIAYEEITVTRRLHRDGTSAYLINKLPVRLRDITNLFLGTGVGTKAYAIIEQGRVGLIVSAKPEDRRLFIEEAAGITKYRRRRQAAERKMDATRQNLLRVSDVLDELGSRLGSLRRQAKKAARYKNYRTEMRDIELWDASHNLLGMIAEDKVICAELLSLEGQREGHQLDLDQREAELEAARLSAIEEERRLTAQQEKLYQLDNRITLTENACEFHTHEAEQLVGQAERSETEATQLRELLAEAEAERTMVSDCLRTTTEEQHSLSSVLEVRQEVLAGVRAELQQVQDQNEIERHESAEAERAAARSEASLRALAQRRNDLEDRVERRRVEASRVVDRLAELTATQGSLDGTLGDLRLTRSQIEERREGAQARIEELVDVAKRGEAELEVLRTELHRRRSRLTSLEEIQQRYEGFGRGTRAVMQRANGHADDRGILGLVADIVEAPAAYETALEAVLDRRLGTVIVEDEGVGVEAIEFLKNNSEGRSSFISRRNLHGPSALDRAPVGVVWEAGSEPSGAAPGGGGEATASHTLSARPVWPASQLPEFQDPAIHGPILELIRCRDDFSRVADNLLGDVVVVDSLERGLKLWETVPEKTLVTLEGEILEPSGTLTGGSLDAEVTGVLRQKREIKELTGIISQLEGDYQQTLDAHVDVKTELASLRQIIDETTRDGHQGDKAILTHEKDLGRIASEIEGLSVRQREIDTELQQLRDTLDEIDSREGELQATILTAEAEHWLADDTVHLLGREATRLGALVDEANASVTDGRVAVAQAEAACQTIVEKLDQIDRMHAERHARIEGLSDGASEGRQRAEELRRKVEELKDELQQAVTDRAQAKDELEAGRTEYDEKAERVAEMEGEIKHLRGAVAELTDGIGAQQLKASEQRMHREHLEELVWDRYREKLTTVASEFHLRPPITEQQLDRLTQLKRLIERMGEINLTAIEEFEEINERFEFLSTHKTDLEGALGQLQRAIQKINRTCRKRFEETFEAVNLKFQEVFPRLFAGGKGKLILSPSESGDVLQGGVDIVAQPPGKKLQSIEMMSGGEKALTAVSLIFSMFLVKPSPFCLLDEVDAPLDEANVVRFREMVRDMSQTSQFIVITHNRRSMEAAHSLYGVTMEEPGISKLVSVQLNDVEL